MENTVVALLLLCALSSAEEAQSQTSPHSGLLDLYTQLGDVRVQLAEDRVMIKELQKDKEELEAKLKVLEEQESKLEPIEEKLKEQAAKVEELEKKSDKVATIIEKPQVTQVAFFATLRMTGGEYFGNEPALTPIIFRHVILNIGDAYSPNTGFFTAPVTGVYHFNFYIYGHVNSAHRNIGAMLVTEGENIVMAFEYQTSGGLSASNGATLLIEAGKAVAVHLWPNTRIYDDSSHHCTFNGYLLFTM